MSECDSLIMLYYCTTYKYNGQHTEILVTRQRPKEAPHKLQVYVLQQIGEGRRGKTRARSVQDLNDGWLKNKLGRCRATVGGAGAVSSKFLNSCKKTQIKTNSNLFNGAHRTKGNGHTVQRGEDSVPIRSQEWLKVWKEAEWATP